MKDTVDIQGSTEKAGVLMTSVWEREREREYMVSFSNNSSTISKNKQQFLWRQTRRNATHREHTQCCIFTMLWGLVSLLKIKKIITLTIKLPLNGITFPFICILECSGWNASTKSSLSIWTWLAQEVSPTSLTNVQALCGCVLYHLMSCFSAEENS